MTSAELFIDKMKCFNFTIIKSDCLLDSLSLGTLEKMLVAI